MTWAEFQIRLFAYNRMEKLSWYKIRELAWCSVTGSHLDPKKMPKTKEQFWNLDNDSQSKSRVSPAQKEAFLTAMAQYVKQTENGKN